jgi:hypothetical protein
MLAGAATPPPTETKYYIVCGNYLGSATFEFSQDAYTAGVVTSVEVHKNPFALPAPDPAWATVYSASATRPGPTAPWATTTEQHTAYNGFPAPAVTYQAASKQTERKVSTCEIQGRAVIDVSCGPGNQPFHVDETVSWPGCGN